MKRKDGHSQPTADHCSTMKTEASRASVRMAVLLLTTVAGSAAAAPPQIVPSVLFQHSAVDLGKSNNFTVSVTGDAPLFFQWRLDGVELPTATNGSLMINPARESDEGDYTLVIT